MTAASEKVRVIEGATPGRILLDEMLEGRAPILLKGLVSDWPLVRAGRESLTGAMKLLAAHDSGKAVNVYIGDSDMAGRFAYDETCSGFNYRTEKMKVTDVLAAISDEADSAEHAYYYINSLVYQEGFPGLLAENNLNLDAGVVNHFPHTSRIWIGTESRASAHWDIPNNIACCLVGKRRFTLFPPEQVENLYPGPLHLTPGGQAVSMVDLKNPDFERYPLAKEALRAAITVDMEPGDALYYPSMWWHEVEAQERFNVMVNYWWTDCPAHMGNPMDILMHAVLGLRDRPEAEKKAWRALFDYYIFGPAERPRAHLPQGSHGALASLDDTMARRLRAQIQHNLNR